MKTIPLLESQLRTYLDTGKIEVVIPEPMKPMVIGDQLSPVNVGDRVAIGEEWRAPRWDADKGIGVYYRDEEFRWFKPHGYTGITDEPEHVVLARELLGRKWFAAKDMPEWAARHHASVSTIALERRGDQWAWIVGLEAVNAD